MPTNEIAYLDGLPYNRPVLHDSAEEELFREEYASADSIVRSKLAQLGAIDAFGRKEFSMGDPWNSSRLIGVTVNSKHFFTTQLVELLQTAVNQIVEKYMVMLSGEYELGQGQFYIFITKDEVIGCEDRIGMLAPFGFS